MYASARARFWPLACGLLAAALAAGCSPQATPDNGPAGLAEGRPAAQPTAARPEPQGRRVFVSPLAGAWYEADPQKLRDQLDQFLKQAGDEHLDNVCALIQPHAGYQWSGPTAAYGVRQLAGRSYRRVVILGPSHRVYMERVASVPDATHYVTPLGEIPLDTAMIRRLRQHPRLFVCRPEAHRREHSVQIHLPMLQHVLGSFQLTPIVVGRLEMESARRMGEVLRELVDDQTLVVASSDFTHYGANFDYYPFRENVPENLRQLDMGAVEQIRQKNIRGFYDYCLRTGATICGRCAIAVLLAMLPEDAQIRLLHYDTSGRISGDYSSSVSYCSIAVTGRWPRRAAPGEAAEPSLSRDDLRRLVQLARATLEHTLRHGRRPTVDELDIEITPGMRRVAGAFVTLHKHGRLRGCIGEILPQRPVYQAVMDHAIDAALRDPRFIQVQPQELPELEYEVSVLTPPRPVGSPAEIQVGRHGVVLRKDGRSAVYLPQVAPEQGWDRETMLNHLAEKAGLPADAWRQGAVLMVFEAQVCGEGDG